MITYLVTICFLFIFLIGMFVYVRLDIKASELKHQNDIKEIEEEYKRKRKETERRYPRWNTNQFVLCMFSNKDLSHEKDCVCVVEDINFHAIDTCFYNINPFFTDKNKVVSFIKLFDVKNNRHIFLRRYEDGKNLKDNEMYITLSRVYDVYYDINEYDSKDIFSRNGYCVVYEVLNDDSI